MTQRKNEFLSIVRNAGKCCQEVSPKWILSTSSELGVFNGCLFGTPNTQIPGTMFSFCIIIREATLDEPPFIRFKSRIVHPFIFPELDYSLFCFPYPPDYTQRITSRTSMHEILEKLHQCFFMYDRSIQSLFIYDFKSDTFPNDPASRAFRELFKCGENSYTLQKAFPNPTSCKFWNRIQSKSDGFPGTSGGEEDYSDW